MNEIWDNRISANFIDLWLSSPLWNYTQMNVPGYYWWLVKFDSGNGLVPPSKKPLPEPVLCRHMASLGHNWLNHMPVQVYAYKCKSYKRIADAHAACQVSATHLKIGYPEISSPDNLSSNELQWFDLDTGDQNNASSYGYHGNMPHSLPHLSSLHYSDAIMAAMASQITRLSIVYSTVYWGADQRKYQSSASLAFVRGIHRWPVNSPHKWPVTRKMFPLDDVIMDKRWIGDILDKYSMTKWQHDNYIGHTVLLLIAPKYHCRANKRGPLLGQADLLSCYFPILYTHTPIVT